MKGSVTLSADEAKKHCVKFTLSVFSRVDKQEKSGGATMQTVLTLTPQPKDLKNTCSCKTENV